MSTDTGTVSVRVQLGRKNHKGHGILIGTIYRGQQMFPIKKKTLLMFLALWVKSSL